MSVFLKLFHKMQTEESFLVYEVTVTMMSKEQKDSKKKANYRAMFVNEHR